MDLKNILSPQETTNGAVSLPVNSSPGKSPKQTREQRSASNPTRKSFTSSPHPNSNNAPSALPPHILASPRKLPPSPSAMSPTIGAIGTTPPPTDSVLSRKASTTSNVDQLASIAADKRPKPVKTVSGDVLRDVVGSPSPSVVLPKVPPLTPRDSYSSRVKESSTRTDFTGTSLSEDDQQLANQLSASLTQDPYSYDTQRQMCKLLHKGFRDHIYPPDSPDSHGDPRTYDLLVDLRRARENMATQYALGHDLWTEYIQDESILASTVDDRIAVMELCKKAVGDEFGCTKLWGTFGEWMLYLYNAARQPDVADGGSNTDWSEEDKSLGKEVFKWESVLDVWRRGAEFSKWRMHDSHLVWNKYMELLEQDLSMTNPVHTPEFVKQELEARLKTPHKEWEASFEFYSTFISKRPEYRDAYEDIMVVTRQQTENARKAWAVREQREIPLKQAADNGETALQYDLFVEYLGWSTQPSIMARPFGGILANALFERAVLYFPTDMYLWQEYSYFVVEQNEKQQPVNMSLFGVLERATRHCPWSGSLWSQYLLSSEHAEHTFEETAEIKHKATTTGVLATAGLEEYLKVLTAWCSYLRRRAFSKVGHDDADEVLDMAEMGIRSSIEELQKLGENKYGEKYEGDPYFRLERIYIRFYCESGSWDNAREIYRSLMATRGDSYDFWIRYYHFEMLAWARFIRHKDHEFGTPAASQLPEPEYATAVLKQALQRPNLDYPEEIAKFYIGHCEDHETVQQLQLAIVEVNRANTRNALRRQREAAEALDAAEAARVAEAQATGQAAFMSLAEVQDESMLNGKRKRSIEDDGETSALKRPRSDEHGQEGTGIDQHQGGSANTAPKRDRENCSILVRNIPDGISDVRIRQFFRDCGHIISVNIQMDGDHKVALVEFEHREDAEYAQSRNGRDFEGQPIEVEIGRGTTLYVTNYPPSADENYMLDLFGKYGEILSVRFPSLKYDSHRRFCYVQFKSAASASTATELDGTLLDGKFKLLARHSDPSIKQNRVGAVDEKREVFVRNIPKTISETELQKLFSDYGVVERVNIPGDVKGNSKGFGFVTFATKESANASLALNGTPQYGRSINVVMAKPQGKRSATTIISRQDRSGTSASPAPDDHLNGAHHQVSRKSSDAMSVTSPSNEAQQPASASYRDRSIALMNVPDTVNDTRVRAFAERFGVLVKIILRPDHAGAIIEYASVADAGKAGLGLDGAEIAPGRKVKVGTVAEMMRQRGETKIERVQARGAGRSKAAPSNTGRMQPSSFTKRPGVGRGAGGVRSKPGLGFGAMSKSMVDDHQSRLRGEDKSEADGKMDIEGVSKGKAKSNADFRAMITGGK